MEQVDVRARQTQPPEHYTEGNADCRHENAARFVSDERLKQRLKENAGIGTEATRAGIIQTLLKRGYLIKQRRFLLATDTASTLIDALPETLKDPAPLRYGEQMLDDIATGKMGLEAFPCAAARGRYSAHGSNSQRPEKSPHQVSKTPGVCRA